MLKYVSFVITFMVCISGMRSGIYEERYESFCSARPPIVKDDSTIGYGEFTHKTTTGGDSWLIKLNKKEDDGINITVSSFDLESFYLVIREASITSSGKIQLISGKSSENLTFFVPYTKSFYMEICPEDTASGSGSFTIAYGREVPDFGEGPLPTEPPEVEKERQAVEIQFKGKPPNEFKDELFILLFKEAVKSIARDFCLEAKIPFEKNKSAEEMVTIHNIQNCPLEWSDADICTSVHHSVFVSGGDNVERRIWAYQLMRPNLQKMWMAADNKYLKRIGLSIYEPPDKTAAIGWWFLVVVLPFLFVIGLVFLLRATYNYIIEDYQSSPYVNVEATGVEKRRKRKLKPNKYQDVPSFFKEEKTTGETGVKEGVGTQKKQRSYRAALLLSRFKLNETIPE